MGDYLPQVDLSFMEQGVNVIQNEILKLSIIVGLTMVALLVIFKVTKMPDWLRRIIFPCVTIAVFALLLFKQYLPNVVKQLGLIFG